MTRAAERLGICQPPLSQQIKALEDELGVALFRRLPRGMRLTEAGSMLQEKLKPVMAQIDTALEAARSAARGEAGRLAIGVSSSAVVSPLIPRLVRLFRRSSPNVAVSIEENGAEDLLLGLSQEVLDIAFTRSAITLPPGITATQIDEEPMVVALPNNHPLKAKAEKGIALAELANEPFILYRRPGGPGLYDAILVACRDAGFSPRIAQEALRLPSTLNFVAAGLGVSIVPASLRSSKVEGAVFGGLSNTDLKAPLYLMHRSGRPAGAVANLLKQVKNLKGLRAA